ncbi:LtfC-like domain-containing protein [Nocardia gipuzkoensis]
MLSTGTFPAGIELFIHFRNGEDGEWADKWHYVISGNTATVLVESEVADLIPDGTDFRLTVKDTNVTPSREKHVCIGIVKRVGK